MEKKARIDSLQETGFSLEIGLKKVLIGRSKECDICIPEQHISRYQAEIYFEDNNYVIENLGRNPIIVINGKQIEKHVLRDGDHFFVGKWEYVLHVEESEPVVPEPVFEEKTVFLKIPADKESLPRVVIIFPDGQSKSYDINKDTLFIGRSTESDICLSDPSISRKHCVIEKGLEGYFIKNLNQTNPLYFRSKRVVKKRFFSGDQFKTGPYTFTFLSDKSEDQPPKSKGTHVSIWISGACLLIVLTSVILYYQVYGPWKAGKTLKTASAFVNEGSYIEAHEILTRLLDTNPPKREFQKAKELLTRVTLSQAKAWISEDKLSDTKRFLVTYLSKYGLDEGSRDAWDLLDLCRIRLGRQLENAKEYTEALKEFSTIKADSPYYDETQRTISRLWLTNQQSSFQRQTVSQLLEEAGEHFEAKRYLTPINKNAYAAYQAVLSFDPDNNIAKNRIEEIKDFFRQKGEDHFQNHNYATAVSFFEKYMLIDPQEISIKEKVVKCRQKLAETKQKLELAETKQKLELVETKQRLAETKQKLELAEKQKLELAETSETGKEEDARREKIKNLLEESGSESSWVMKYLFEEEAKQNNSEKPW